MPDNLARANRLDESRRHVNAAAGDAGAMAPSAVRTGWPSARVRPVRRHTARRVDLRLVPRRVVSPDVRPGRGATLYGPLMRAGSSSAPRVAVSGRICIGSAVDGTGEAQRLTDSDRRHVAGSWDPSGRILAFTEYDPQSGAPTIMLLRLEGDEASGWRPAQANRLHDGTPTIRCSHPTDDGWRTSQRSPGAGDWKFTCGRSRVRAAGGRVSTDGGDNPAWSLTRRELLYATPDHRIMAVPYSVNRDSFHAEKPRVLAELAFCATRGRSQLRSASGRRQDCAGQGARGARPRSRHLDLQFS